VCRDVRGDVTCASLALRDQLEILQGKDPRRSLLIGAFPRSKAQAKRQILWYSDRERGAEEDLT
jgi:hypothetical protein